MATQDSTLDRQKKNFALMGFFLLAFLYGSTLFNEWVTKKIKRLPIESVRNARSEPIPELPAELAMLVATSQEKQAVYTDPNDRNTAFSPIKYVATLPTPIPTPAYQALPTPPPRPARPPEPKLDLAAYARSNIKVNSVAKTGAFIDGRFMPIGSKVFDKQRVRSVEITGVLSEVRRRSVIISMNDQPVEIFIGS